MRNYNSLGDALDDLRKRGYKADFDFDRRKSCLYCEGLDITLDPDDFHVDEVYRFQGESAVDKHSILFAISSSTGVRGILVDEYAVNLTPFH